MTEIYSELDFLNAFGKADDTLSTAARSISELITCEGRINLDFNDVKTTLENGGVAIISSGYGEGERRMTKAIEDALNSPLLKNRDVYGSKRILVNIYFSRNAEQKFVMSEVNEMREFMCNFAPEVDVIWGVAFDDTLGEKVKVTILASGFNVTLNNEISTKPAAGKPAFVEPDPSDGIKRIIDEVRDRFDYIFIDCSPSLGYTTVNILTAADSVLIPVQCEYLALEGLSKLLNTIKKVKSGLNPALEIEGFVMTMYMRNRLNNQVTNEVREHFGPLAFDTIIQRNIRLGEAPSHGKPIMLYDASATGAVNYLTLAKEFLKRNRKKKQNE